MSQNWDDLKVVLAIGRAGSLTRAADLLGMDQSTVGRRLTMLEADLGASLFTRSKAGISPTEIGETAIARAEEIELRYDRLRDDITRSGDDPTGTVRLLGNGWMLTRLIENGLAEFLAVNPGIDLRLISFPPRVTRRREASLALWFDRQPQEPEFAIKLGDVAYSIYVAKSADPKNLGWLVFNDEDAPRLKPIRTIERLRKRGERVRMASTDAGLLMAAARAGIGKALLPCCLAQGCPDLVRQGDGPPDLTRALHLHLHPDTVQTVRVQRTVRWLRESFSKIFTVPGQLS